MVSLVAIAPSPSLNISTLACRSFTCLALISSLSQKILPVLEEIYKSFSWVVLGGINELSLVVLLINSLQ
jgi:hypothetical protein